MLKQTDQEERIREATSGSLAGSGAALNRPADLLQLTKPRITTMVLVSSAAGFVIASGGHPDPGLLLLTMVGIGLVAGGTSALNQLIERDVDARMERTRNRPLPTGRVTPRAAGFFSAAISLAGIGLLAVAVNTLTALLASIALLSYVLVYTPLKRVSSLSTLVGAIPGALPIMGGWTAARGELGPGAWALFGIMFFWQLPHFLALAWMFREDYQRGGLRMLGVTDPSGEQTRTQAVLYALALIPASLLPAILGLSGALYGLLAIGLGVAYLVAALRFWSRADSPSAQRLFRTSLVYLPVLLLVLSFDPGAGSDPSGEAATASRPVATVGSS
ncbi:MAG: heme o synthase [marine benthic group bacterium]|jgi:protoheme IX farnesyltransferase|nr:heme o synthase [Gemmatimonadota bacterium]MCL7963090.1 heme o synthase [Candidatus Carthagonibacter metallireducens]MCL7981486.1 heme o synthase [Gemmatimonadota bacterium]MCL7991308.1 heme o synthase [Gemmatimonadota bacterium]